ncbi:MAG: tetratricopeptide repeat protein [Trueperaceae bacterium]
MSGRILATVAAFALLAVAYAETLVVYPFDSRDSFLGSVVADQVALAFEGATDQQNDEQNDEFEVYGPAVAPSLVPPLPVGEGFLNPTEFLQGSGAANRTGSALLRDALGATAVLTGEVVVEDDRLSARLYLATEGEVHSFIATSSLDDPGTLASRIVSATALRLGAPVERLSLDLDLSGLDGELAQALALIAAGLTEDARRVLENMEQRGDRATGLLGAMQELERQGDDADPALLATLAVNRQPLDERSALHYFQLLVQESELPAAELWVAVLEASVNDLQAAEQHFAELSTDFTYGQAARAAFLVGVGAAGSDQSLATASSGEPLALVLESEDVAALVGMAAVAASSGDIAIEKEALTRLTRVAPFFGYPFERLSFIAFDENEAQAAAEALAVAVELEPESDLYWTNLGWAYYLLGMLEKSEVASLRAVALDPSQYIAQYNLGLALAVTNRLSEAVDAYRAALRVDPEVDDAAIEDLERALELYPDQPAVHYVLAMLYEAEGRRSDAARQFGRFVDRSGDESFLNAARERVEVLSAPPPPIELSDGLVTVRLGSTDIARGPFHPADPLYPNFEVYTPGDELPQTLNVSIDVTANDGQTVFAVERAIEIPRGAIGYVVDDLEVQLPDDLQPGAYHLEVEVLASEGRSASGTVMFEVSGEPQLVRQLLGRNLLMQGLQTGVRLYGPEDISNPERVTEVLLNELQASADAAEEALPAVETGRFGGMTGGEFFRNSTAEDVSDFIAYMLASGVRDSSFIFAEAYAQWALEGAPPVEE